MKIYIAYILVLLSSVIFFTSCEDMESEVDIEPIPSKIIVTSFITPNMPNVYVRVYKSRALYTPYDFDENDDFLTIDDAFVSMTNGIDTVALNYDNESSSYVIDKGRFPITKGTTYYLSVITQEGDSASASTTVPTLTPPQIELTGIDSTITYEGMLYYANVRFKDIEGQGQLYCCKAGAVYWGEGMSTPYLGEIGFQRGESFISDKNKDGEYFSFSTNNFPNNPDEPTRLYLTLSITDEHYYNYHKGLEDYDEDNPFAEPVPVYSNVKGGLGIFASYVQAGTAFDF